MLKNGVWTPGNSLELWLPPAHSSQDPRPID
jgi:hypothetical protein